MITERWILCLKHGTKYNADYVNKLYNMCKRHTTLQYNFACITEDPSGLNPNIKIIPLPNYQLAGWWYKPWVFSNEIPVNGTLLFLDLDLVIIKNIDHLWTLNPSRFCIIKDFNRSIIKGWEKFNSSVFRFEKGEFAFVWDNLVKDFSQTKRMHGDQDWIYSQIKHNYAYWPDEWIQSYKWEIRDRSDVIKDGTKRVFKNIANPIINPDTSILVFHGDPKPEEVSDPIVVQNWR